MVSALSGESKLWGDSHRKGAGKLVGNFELNPLKETNLDVAQPFLTPKRDHFKL